MTQPERSRPIAPWRAALAGLVAGAAAISAAELVAGLVPGAPSLVVAMGDLLISLQPPGAKEVVVALFGTNDKLAVNILIVVVALALGAGLGVLARRRWGAAVAGFAAVGALMVVASLREPLVSRVLAILVPVLAVVIAVRLLRLLLDLAAAEAGEPASAPAAGEADAARATAAMPDWRRRRFLLAGAGVAAASVVAGFTGRRLLDGGGISGGSVVAGGQGGPGIAGASPGSSAGPGVTAAGLPVPESTAPPIPAGATLDLPGITPLVVPNDRFYRIDTALVIPRVDAATWKLTVKGMVEREIELRYADLVALPQFEQYVTIACVSNDVGGDLVGNAKWQGVHLRTVLEMAGVKPGATQIVGRSVDDFTAGFPTAWAMDPARDPMIAIGMNGVPLPVPHGYPARLIIPGLYGYVSATKWLKEIELTTLDAFDAYWIPLGWAKEAPILTQARIDTPRRGARVPVGRVGVGGVAWAPDRGISKVEVRIQGGEWQQATITTPLANSAWVQWRFDWDAVAPGNFDLTVRATDGTGTPQEERVTPPAPDGARGYHRVNVEVTA